ncbi:hypothetical protein SAMN05216464_106249 [Mucilaginibacter pineti]|uniref:PBCV-specific basic adaptor domain-containing protein n=1 Tax=Mucilaginibacter pineti TaxID=1391627 RepID=A0A1G7D5I3_9SPHI|nr:hypothetical protein [Mucilaginibacter pineti]SDE46791.1 hypothetical protein SAMN05216464_106249 [Mucilaginibacter pineti]
MKNLFKIAMFAAGSFMISQTSFAQTHKDSTLGHKIGNTAKKVGHKTSEIAAKGAAGVVDKKYDGKVAPGGQTIYIDKNSYYYYINKKGHKVYVKKSLLVDKPAT